MTVLAFSNPHNFNPLKLELCQPPKAVCEYACTLSLKGEGNGYPLQYSCLGNPMGRELHGYSQWGWKESDSTEQLTLSLKLPQFSVQGKTLLWKRSSVFSLLQVIINPSFSRSLAWLWFLAEHPRRGKLRFWVTWRRRGSVQKKESIYSSQHEYFPMKDSCYRCIIALIIAIFSWPYYFQFSSVQSLSCVQLFATLWIATRQSSLSITNSQSLLKLMSIEVVIPSSHLILCHPLLLLPPIPPSIRVFSNQSTLPMRWPRYWSFSFSSSPSNEHPGLMYFRIDWLDLLAVQGTLKSLLQHHSSKASILQHSALFIVQLSHPYMTNGKTIALTRWTFVGKVMSVF